jgi:RNA polymerase sigma factor (sigma-70 family)
MQETGDGELLRQYVESGSDDAFAALVSRHINLVYSVALRHVGDRHAAEEITQAVFILLAKKARQLRHDKALSSWLFQATRLTAANFVRSESRRQRREQEAHMQRVLNDAGADIWSRIGPLLDTAVAALRDKDRQAIVLRFYEGRSLREVAAGLGASEDAAEKRVGRALERLRAAFAKGGVRVTTGVIAGAVAGNSIQAAPLGLAAVIAATVGEGVAVGSTLTLMQTALELMSSIKAKTAGVSAIVIASLTSPFVVNHRAQARLAAQDTLLREQAERLAALRTEQSGLSQLAATSGLSREQLNELERLRAQIGPLLNQAQQVAALQRENARLETSLQKPRNAMQIKEEMIARSDGAREWVDALFRYAKEHRGNFPTRIEDAAPFLSEKGHTNMPGDRFEIVFSGSPAAVTNPGNIILLREKQAWQNNPNDKWGKYYGYADGTVLLHLQADSNFDEFERQHLAPLPNP